MHTSRRRPGSSIQRCGAPSYSCTAFWSEPSLVEPVPLLSVWVTCCAAFVASIKHGPRKKPRVHSWSVAGPTTNDFVMERSVHVPVCNAFSFVECTGRTPGLSALNASPQRHRTHRGGPRVWTSTYGQSQAEGRLCDLLPAQQCSCNSILCVLCASVVVIHENRKR